MKTFFTKTQIIGLGKSLAKAGFVAEYKPRSHSHNVFTLFPQTESQYKWLKKECGITDNVCILCTKDEIISAFPELDGFVFETKSGSFSRIKIILP